MQYSIQCRSLRRILFFVALLIFTSASNAQAASGLSPFDAPITSGASFKSIIKRSLESRQKVTTVEALDQIVFTAQIQSLGNVTFSLNREWRVPDVSFADNGFALQQLPRNGVHLQGEAILRISPDDGVKSKLRVPLAASIFGLPGESQQLEAVFFAGLSGGEGNFYKVSARLADGNTVEGARAVRISASAFQGRTCGLLSSTASHRAATIAQRLNASSSKPPATAPATYKNFDISTEADYEYFVAHGSASNTKIQSILNQVQTIYQNQLGLTFSLIQQVVVTTSGSRYTSYNVETLLDSFRSYGESRRHLGSADVYHLFTGKDTFFSDNGASNYSVIGLAYVGVVCAYPEYGYGLTENFNDALNHITVAHEIGHNFSAEHDAAGSIMGTVLNLNSPPTEFSTASKNQIASHVNTNSSCLTNSDGSSSPTPTPTAGGGGGTTPGDGDTSHVLLEVSLSGRGILNTSVTLDAADSACTVSLRAATTSGGVFNGTEIASASAGFSLTQYSGIGITRKTLNSGKKAQKVYLGATKTCGETIYYSAVKSIAPYRVRSSRVALSTKAWIRLLAKQVKAATPLQS